MSLEFHPVGLKCNLSCVYCYEHTLRHSQDQKFNLGTLVKTCVDWKKKGIREITLHGGEPLLLSLTRLEQALEVMYQSFGHTTIQTNGTLITPDHIEMFKRYETRVGVSLDGPGRCSQARWGIGGKDMKLVERADHNLSLLLQAKLNVSLIATLWCGNCQDPEFHDLCSWFDELDFMGLKSARLHFLQGSPELRVEDKLLTQRLIHLSEMEVNFKNLRFDIFTEMVDLLAGRHRDYTCIWNNCDPSNATAGRSIGPDGTYYNCGRLGCAKPIDTGSRRLDVLRTLTPDSGGCKGCRYLPLCKGGCPGTGLDGDPMKRTSDCVVIKNLFEHFETTLARAGILPVTRRLRQVNRSECEQKRRYPVEVIDPTLWTDNGFKSKFAMDRAHGPVVDAAVHCAYQLGNTSTRPIVCDFGCGNGELLNKINGVFKIQAAGVDCSPRIIEKAKRKFPDGLFTKAKVSDPLVLNMDVALISIQRLREVEGIEHRILMDNLSQADYVVFYDYGDNDNPSQYLRNYFGNLVWSPTEFRSSGCERPYVTITIVEPRHEQNASV